MLYTITIKKYWVEVTASNLRKRFYAWQIYPDGSIFLLTDGKESMVFSANETFQIGERIYTFAEIDAMTETILDSFFALPELKFS